MQVAFKSIHPLFAEDKKTIKALLTRSKRQVVGQTFDPPPTPPSPPPPPNDPPQAVFDFLKELLKALLFAAAYDLLKWFITHLRLLEEERSPWLESNRPFAGNPYDFLMAS